MGMMCQIRDEFPDGRATVAAGFSLRCVVGVPSTDDTSQAKACGYGAYREHVICGASFMPKPRRPRKDWLAWILLALAWCSP